MLALPKMVSRLVHGCGTLVSYVPFKDMVGSAAFGALATSFKVGQKSALQKANEGVGALLSPATVSMIQYTGLAYCAHKAFRVCKETVYPKPAAPATGSKAGMGNPGPDVKEQMTWGQWFISLVWPSSRPTTQNFQTVESSEERVKNFGQMTRKERLKEFFAQLPTTAPVKVAKLAAVAVAFQALDGTHSFSTAGRQVGQYAVLGAAVGLAASVVGTVRAKGLPYLPRNPFAKAVKTA